MAQTGYTPILIYSSTTASQAPAAGNLTNSTLGSELAINITDGKLFYKDNANAVQVIGWKVTPTTAGGTGLTSYVAGDTLYYASGTTLSKLAIGSTGYWMGSSGTAPQWNAPAALTKTDDTNVTLTLGGSASTALLNAASLTLGWTGQLSVARGGTGQASWTANGVLYASGTTTLATSSALTYDGTNWLLGALGTGTNAQVSTAGIYASQAVSPSLMRSAAIVTNNNSGYVGWDFISLDAVSKSALPSTGSAVGTMLSMNGNTLDVKFNSGNLVQGTAAKGINFTANTGAAGKTSQLLNWYEEGTFTPSLQFGGASTGITYSVQTGRYTRIGRQVTLQVRIVLSSKGSATGNASIVGLPFNSSTDNYPATIVDPSADFVSLVAGGATLIVISVDTLYFLQQTTTGRANMTNANFGNSSDFRFAITYNV